KSSPGYSMDSDLLEAWLVEAGVLCAGAGPAFAGDAPEGITCAETGLRKPMQPEVMMAKTRIHRESRKTCLMRFEDERDRGLKLMFIALPFFRRPPRLIVSPSYLHPSNRRNSRCSRSSRSTPANSGRLHS